MPGNNESHDCDSMSRSELENQFKTINDNFQEMKGILAKISERQQDHYLDFTKLAMSVVQIKEKVKDLEQDQEKEIKIIWKKIHEKETEQKENARLKDKKNMWIIGLIVTFSTSLAAALASLATFLSN